MPDHKTVVVGVNETVMSLCSNNSLSRPQYGAEYRHNASSNAEGRDGWTGARVLSYNTCGSLTTRYMVSGQDPVELLSARTDSRLCSRPQHRLPGLPRRYSVSAPLKNDDLRFIEDSNVATKGNVIPYRKNNSLKMIDAEEFSPSNNKKLNDSMCAKVVEEYPFMLAYLNKNTRKRLRVKVKPKRTCYSDNKGVQSLTRHSFPTKPKTSAIVQSTKSAFQCNSSTSTSCYQTCTADSDSYIHRNIQMNKSFRCSKHNKYNTFKDNIEQIKDRIYCLSSKPPKQTLKKSQTASSSMGRTMNNLKHQEHLSTTTKMTLKYSVSNQNVHSQNPQIPAHTKYHKILTCDKRPRGSRTIQTPKKEYHPNSKRPGAQSSPRRIRPHSSDDTLSSRLVSISEEVQNLACKQSKSPPTYDIFKHRPLSFSKSAAIKLSNPVEDSSQDNIRVFRSRTFIIPDDVHESCLGALLCKGEGSNHGPGVCPISGGSHEVRQNVKDGPEIRPSHGTVPIMEARPVTEPGSSQGVGSALEADSCENCRAQYYSAMEFPVWTRAPPPKSWVKVGSNLSSRRHVCESSVSETSSILIDCSDTLHSSFGPNRGISNTIATSHSGRSPGKNNNKAEYQVKDNRNVEVERKKPNPKKTPLTTTKIKKRKKSTSGLGSPVTKHVLSKSKGQYLKEVNISPRDKTTNAIKTKSEQQGYFKIVASKFNGNVDISHKSKDFYCKHLKPKLESLTKRKDRKKKTRIGPPVLQTRVRALGRSNQISNVSSANKTHDLFPSSPKKSQTNIHDIPLTNRQRRSKFDTERNNSNSPCFDFDANEILCGTRSNFDKSFVISEVSTVLITKLKGKTNQTFTQEVSETGNLSPSRLLPDARKKIKVKQLVAKIGLQNLEEQENIGKKSMQSTDSVIDSNINNVLDSMGTNISPREGSRKVNFSACLSNREDPINSSISLHMEQTPMSKEEFYCRNLGCPFAIGSCSVRQDMPSMVELSEEGACGMHTTTS